MFAALKVAQPRSVKKSGLQRLIRSVTQTTVNKMSYSEEHIRNKLTKELEASHVEVVDESDGCGGKFSCVVVSEKFRGKPLIQRHRLVNSALQEELKTIHAFSQKTFTPEQWKEQNS
jgi:stress-induced morphogen